MSNRASRGSFAIDVFSAREIARAAGTSTADARALLTSGAVRSGHGGLVATGDAVRAVLLLRGAPAAPVAERQLFSPLRHAERRTGAPLTASGFLHLGFVAVLLTAFGMSSPAAVKTEPEKPARLVFLVKPGPGGGGGGGGLRQPAPARPALMKGSSTLKSPVPVERAVRRPAPEPPKPKPQPVPEVRPVEKPVEPPPPPARPDPPPPVVAPVVSAPAETKDQPGILTPAPAPVADSQGSGVGGGAGTGGGTGIGAGNGPGIGEGSGGGTGGGPYRPGSGITAPSILQEVKPDYTEEARRRGLAGDVVLEIVVRADGRVGTVRIVQGLGAGLDQRAIDAVRQWRFTPARRLGTPVDVLVEVAVEFRLR